MAHALRFIVVISLVVFALFVNRDAGLLLLMQNIIFILANRALKVIDATLNCFARRAREHKEGNEIDEYVADDKDYDCDNDCFDDADHFG